MAKLWAKGYDLDAVIEAFTVGDDYLLDRRLVIADCLGSIAHARMLREIGLLSTDESDRLVSALRELARRTDAGDFTVRREDEDCHTAIESVLVSELGELGKRVHTGRSRNDQVLLALRLFEREFILQTVGSVLDLVDLLLDLATTHANVPMVGRTHMQPAMPSSVGLWSAAWAEELLADAGLLYNTYSLVNRSPLGSAASYGTSLPLDREMVCDALGFDGLLNNVLWANNSRCKIESVLVDALDQGGLTLSKMAQDLILFSLPEFGYFTLPEDLCTGSSIMPQKRNPDALELLRAKSGTVSACSTQIKNILRSLPSGYNRDFQEAKEPLFRAMDTFGAGVGVMVRTLQGVEIHADTMKAAFDASVFATDEAYDMVRNGVPFRDAYRRVAERLDDLPPRDPVAALKARTSTGTAGNLNLQYARRQSAALRTTVASDELTLRRVTENLLGGRMRVYR